MRALVRDLPEPSNVRAGAGTLRCLDADDATAYAAGRLTPEELAVVDDHIDSCVACRKLLSRAAEMMTPLPGASVDDGLEETKEPARDELSAGAVVGRYVIDARVGAGGMGVVYAAHDPELRRKVALKVMRARVLPGDHLAEELLRREAMAMARVAHPNVVGVYDLFVAAGTMFVAMEFIEGRTLRAWVEQAPRSWREVLSVMMLAGRGLAAAHAEGIVHRDLKPENILVGSSGRVCVSDFGLSRLAAGIEAAERIERGGEPALSTLAGGTPRYMAPEQHEGATATARSDQLSFCIAMYEALYAEHPFGRAGRGAAVSWQVQPAPPKSDVPGWVRRCLLRGLARDPGERYATIDDLLADLQRDPSTRRRRVLTAVAAAAALATTAGVVLHARQVRRDVCAHADAKLSGVWDAGQKRAGAQAFEAVKTPFARDEWGFVERALDRYTGKWVQARTQACEAVLARADAADVERDARVQCLDDRLEETRAVVSGVLGVTRDDQVGTAVTAAESIQPIESCARAFEPLHAARATPEKLERAAGIRADLARATAFSYLGRSEEALALADKAAESAERDGDDALLARALRRAAHARASLGGADWKAEEARLYRAIELADAVGDDETRASAWHELLFITGVVERKATPAEAKRFFEQGMSAVKRLGGDDVLEALLRNAFASALSLEGEDEESNRQFELGLGAATRADYRLLIGDILDNLGQADLARGDLEAAGDHLRRAEETLLPLVGERHRFVLTVRNDAALLHLQRGEFAAARDLASTVVEGFAALGRGESDDASTALATLADALLELHDAERARLTAARSVAVREKLKQPLAHLVGPLATLGRAWLELDDPTSALEPLERAVSSDKGEPESRADARFGLARVLIELHRDRERATALAVEAKGFFDALPSPTPFQSQKRERVRAFVADGLSPPDPKRP